MGRRPAFQYTAARKRRGPSDKLNKYLSTAGVSGGANNIAIMGKFITALPFILEISFWEKFVYALKIISFIISSVFAVGVIFAIVKMIRFTKPDIDVGAALSKVRLKPPPSEKERFRREWLKIVQRMESGLDQDMTLAIIEADTLVDVVLRRAGYRGNTLAERMKQLDSARLKSLNDLWDAHKLRNMIVHMPNFKISVEEAHNALKKFKKALEEFGAI